MTRTLYREAPYARECDARVLAVDADRVVLDCSVFYPTGGGQPGDTGVLVGADGVSMAVTGTQWSSDGQCIEHLVPGASTRLCIGDSVCARLDWARRYRLMRYHTCLHLLCAVVGAPVTGGRMAEDKAHLDFDIEMDQLDAAKIELQLAELVAADLPVEVGTISEAELDANPGLVKTMSVQPPRGRGSVRTIAIHGVDLQPCGGTHLARTGEIGTLRVTRIRSEGKRNKRVTIALTD